VELPFDKSKNQRRAFCFITFETEDMVDKAVVSAKQKVGDKEVDVRKATPKSDQDGFAGRGGRGGAAMRGGGRGGAYNAGYQAGYPPAPYDYSGYYGAPVGYPGYGYPGYGGAAPGYDYSSYYGQQPQQQPGADWSSYGGYAAYPNYDYSAYYGGASQGQQGAPGGAAAGGAAGGYKAKRGGPAQPGYHPYSR